MDQMKGSEEYKNSNGSTGAFLAGALIGGLASAAATLLFAPQSGDETQEQIWSKANELKSGAEKTIRTKRQATEVSIYKGLNSVAGKLDQIAKTINQQVEEMKKTS